MDQLGASKKHFQIVSQVEIAPERTLVLVGAALDGPSLVPFTLHEESDPYEVLGQCPLADAYWLAKKAGAEHIVIYRMNGSHSEAKIRNIQGSNEEVLSLKSVCASDSSNDIQVTVYPDHLFIKNSDGTQRSYFFDKYPTAQDLAYAINVDADFGFVELTAQPLKSDFLMGTLTSAPMDIALVGGSSESNCVPDRSGAADMAWVSGMLKDKLKVALFGEDPLDQTEKMPNSDLGLLHFGVICLVDMYHDDDPEFTELLAEFCMKKTTVNGFGCVGVIGTKPVYEEEDTSMGELVANKVTNLITMAPSDPVNEALYYVQVIVGDTSFPESKGRLVSAAYAYAATQATLPYYTMMTNKSLGIRKLNYVISKEDIETLTANGYICLVSTVRRGVVPYLATSFSKDASLMSKPHHIRISQVISRTLIEGLDNLLGSNMKHLKLNDLNEWTKEVLDRFVDEGAIRDYTFGYKLTGDAELNLSFSFTPYSEVQSVYSATTISIPQGAII